jgi:hypothetical protein
MTKEVAYDHLSQRKLMYVTFGNEDPVLSIQARAFPLLWCEEIKVHKQIQKTVQDCKTND